MAKKVEYWVCNKFPHSCGERHKTQEEAERCERTPERPSEWAMKYTYEPELTVAERKC